jgi:ActR/RegA family two-component response regulator
MASSSNVLHASVVRQSAVPLRSTAPARESVVIADLESHWLERLQHEFDRIGWNVIGASSADSALLHALKHAPDLVIVERALGDMTWAAVLARLRAAGSRSELAVVTSSGSIAEAVAATRGGVAAYLAKPVGALDVLDAVHLGRYTQHTLQWPAPQSRTESYLSLERAKWEYINMTVRAAGSLAEAARRLRVDRRSLRRMLAKEPPTA